jgi:disulfide oxidoreductase YuzD
MVKNPPQILWLPQPEPHNYPAAYQFLCLIRTPTDAKRLSDNLRKIDFIWEFKAKDIFRASGLSLLGISDDHVQKDIKKIEEGKPLSPLLLVRDCRMNTVIIADGYHRLCAIYRFDYDCVVKCKIVS